MQILKDGNGNPQGTIRPLAGNREAVYDNSGKQIAYYDPNTNATYKPSGGVIASGNRLAGLVGRNS